MSKITETAFRKMAMEEIKKLSHSLWFSIQQVAIRGTPDILGLICGKFIALEFKRDERAERSILQQLNLMRINAAGGYGFFCYPENYDDVMFILRQISKGEDLDRTILSRLTKPKLCPSRP